MELMVPADLAPQVGKLSWSLDGGSAIGTAIRIG
jgi:hypothetical protein